MTKQLSIALMTLLAAASGLAADPSPTYREIRETLGLVPHFMQMLPDSAIAGAWQEMKSVELSTTTQIPGKYKELIGLAVAAQIPCRYCAFFHTESAKLNGLTELDTREAVALAAETRHWSTVIQGLPVDEAVFRRDTDKIAEFLRKKAETPPAAAPATVTAVTTPQQAYDDIQKTLGLVPDFVREIPPSALPGAWNEFKALNLNPNTRIPQKYKDLLAVGVDAQIPCRSCLYFDTAMAKVDGATPLEISEAVQMAAVTRHWSTVLNGTLEEEPAFRKETGRIMSFLRARMGQRKEMGGTVPGAQDSGDASE